MNFLKIPILVFICFCLLNINGCNARTTHSKSGSALEVEQSINFSGYPMDASDQTISWFVSTGYLPNPAYVSADRSPFHQWLQEMLGVKITWHFPMEGTPGLQAFYLLLASGDLPYVIYSDVMNNAERYIDEGTIRDLTPYMEKWSPAYFNILKSNPIYDRALKTDTGKYYGYGFFREDGGWNDTYQGPVINKTWLDECGLPMPETISDWDRTLRVFNERYGVALSFAWSRAINESSFISGAFGAHTFADFRLYLNDDRKIQLANIQPEYKDNLMKFAEWWRDGLISQDIVIINDTMARSNALNLKMGISFTSVGQISNWIQDARNNNTGAQWVGLQYPTGDDGTLVQVPGGANGIGPYTAVITTVTPDDKLEMVMRALDYAYTEEGNLFWNFGKRGVSWDYDENGNPVFLPLVTRDPNGLNDAISKYSGTTWGGNCIQATALVKMKNNSVAVAANDLWYYPNVEATYRNKLPVGMTALPEEAARISELTTAIATFVNEEALKFITGQRSFHTWDAYVTRVNAMGVPELLSLYQASYDRYLAR